MEFTQRKRSRKSQSFKLINEGKAAAAGGGGGGPGFVPSPGAARTFAPGGAGRYETPVLPLPRIASPCPYLLFNSAIPWLNSPNHCMPFIFFFF